MSGEAGPSTAIVTSSWRGDLERCRLLCDSIDRHVTGHTAHYILVEHRDRVAFAPLEGPRRHVISERELLPFLLRPFPDPTNPKRRIWLSPFGPPLRGWHVQQLRRIAFGMAMREDVMLSCDSDVVFVRPFASGELTQGGRTRFHRVPNGLGSVSAELVDDHRAWSREAGRLLGIDRPAETCEGYITTLVAWRRDTVRAMADHIARVAGRPALRALAGTRRLSECTIYGRFVDEVENRPDRHAPGERSLARVHWSGAPLDAESLSAFLAGLEPQEVALCLQSFIGTPPALVRAAARL